MNQLYSLFFSKALFGLVSAIVFYIMQMMMVFMIETSDSGGKPSETPIQWLVSFFPHTGVQLAFNLILEFEVNRKPYSFGNLNEAIDNYKVSIAVSSMIIVFIFYTFITIYLDQVFPNEWGQKKHPLFCCVKKKKAMSSSSQQDDDLAEFESVTRAIKEQVSNKQAFIIKNLKKTYANGKLAVNNVSMEIYNGQIFILLGHNGAGKTTTISMLTGLISASAGSAEVFGNSIFDDMDKIRTQMGVCPQHDTLFDDLTVREHLQMYAKFKGMKSEDIDKACDDMIIQLDLQEKADYQSRGLSGGQKRRLSVGIAFIGDSRIVFLDEPTSGMDTSARRFIWSLLKNLKQDKIIILTTHFMDEADYLGDRIGIMSQGRLVCCGSPGWLKNKYGEGYTLTILKEYIESYCPLLTYYGLNVVINTTSQVTIKCIRRNIVSVANEIGGLVLKSISLNRTAKVGIVH